LRSRELSTPEFDNVLAEYERRMAAEAVTRTALPAPMFFARRDDFLLPVGREVAELLRDLVIGLQARRIVELGTSYGYSTLFLADAARRTGGKLFTYESVAAKQAYARERIEDAGLADFVEWRLGDAVALLSDQPAPVDFALLDLWKDLYVTCFAALHPLLAADGLVVADNMLYPESAREHALAYQRAVRDSGDMDSVVLPIGQGICISSKPRQM
jgi:predicted O-methyltransferase YrrM